MACIWRSQQLEKLRDADMAVGVSASIASSVIASATLRLGTPSSAKQILLEARCLTDDGHTL